MLSAEAPRGRRPSGQPAGPLRAALPTHLRSRRGAPVSFCVAATTLVMAIGAAGCGSSDEGSGGDPQTALTVSLDRDGKGGKPAEERTIACGGDTASRDFNCGLLRLMPPIPPPTPPDTACTQLYGGPDVVKLSGTLRDKEVDATLTRANGCEVDSFNPFVPILRELFPGYKPGSALSA